MCRQTVSFGQTMPFDFFDEIRSRTLTGKLLKEIVAGALLRILKKRWRAILFVAFGASVYIKTHIYIKILGALRMF